LFCKVAFYPDTTNNSPHQAAHLRLVLRRQHQLAVYLQGCTQVALLQLTRLQIDRLHLRIRQPDLHWRRRPHCRLCCSSAIFFFINLLSAITTTASRQPQ
jgi:hypothetical protein